MVVDSVSDVVSLAAEEICPPPQLGTALDTDFLHGIGTVDGRMLILLDIERLMSSEELGLVERGPVERGPVERDPVERLAA
jgi:purine-binding chemotaxis protein CheW